LGKPCNLPTTAQTRRHTQHVPHLPIGTPQAEAPLSSCYSLDETSSVVHPWSNILTLSASGRTRGNTSPCSRIIGPDLRPASLPVYQRMPAPPPPLPRSLPSLGWVRDRCTGCALIPQGGSISLPALPVGFSTLVTSRPSPAGP